MAYKWLNSYFENKKQFVSIDKCQSAVRNISCGLPQGSILGPKLFILYVNDMCSITKLVKYILFDDTKMCCADNNIKRLSDTVCRVLDKMSTWFALNRLTLNISKTNYRLFGNCMLSEDVVINIQNVNIERVGVRAKFLGVYVADLLNWNVHIKYVKSKLSKSKR